jgi:GntR family transcriptional regulator, galactonate operon transcriptional repressor
MFARIATPENLHDRVTHALALRVLEAERGAESLMFPNEADLCQQLGVSRTIVREAVKVLTDKGMVEVRPRLGTRARPRSEWNLLDPDILGWQAELGPDARFLRDLCEVRLAIEPIASGFAALRARHEEVEIIGQCLERREARAAEVERNPGDTPARVHKAQVLHSQPGASTDSFDREETVDLDLQFHAAVVAACHNVLLEQLSAAIRRPFRTALSYTTQLRASDALGLAAYRSLYDAILRRDPLRARGASEEIVGLAMLAVEQVIRAEEGRGTRGRAQLETMEVSR